MYHTWPTVTLPVHCHTRALAALSTLTSMGRVVANQTYANMAVKRPVITPNDREQNQHFSKLKMLAAADGELFVVLLYTTPWLTMSSRLTAINSLIRLLIQLYQRFVSTCDQENWLLKICIHTRRCASPTTTGARYQTYYTRDSGLQQP